MKKWIGATALLLITTPALAERDSRELSVNQRQHQIERRIEQGWHSGELTRAEYRRLHYALAEIGRAEHYFRSDGRLSRPERSELHARLDHVSRDVYRQKRDAEQRHGFYNRDYRAERR